MQTYIRFGKISYLWLGDRWSAEAPAALRRLRPNLEEWAEFWRETAAQATVDWRDLAFDGVSPVEPDWDFRVARWLETYGPELPNSIDLPVGFRVQEITGGWMFVDDLIGRSVFVMLNAPRQAIALPPPRTVVPELDELLG